MRIIHIVPMVLLALSTSKLSAAEPLTPSPDPNISSIVSEGYWEDDDMHGVYRVILWSEGFEHISSGVVAEWIADPQDANESPKVVHAEFLVAPGMMTFQKPKIIRTRNGLRMQLSGIHTFDSARKISCKFDLLPNRTVRTVVPCSQ